jgi:hypothetical protein
MAGIRKMDKIGWKGPVGQAENDDLNARGVLERLGKERTVKDEKLQYTCILGNTTSGLEPTF